MNMEGMELWTDLAFFKVNNVKNIFIKIINQS
jgi:hypothetical protein